MLFNSYQFLIVYLPIVMITLYLLARYKPKWAAAWLALASIVFYGGWSIYYIPLLLGSITINFFFGKKISALSAAQQLLKVRALLFCAVTTNLLILCYYKYLYFLVQTISDVTTIPLSVTQSQLPLGISFFTFTQIAFLVDASRRECEEYDICRYGLFVTYFPHLIAGPIFHHKEMMSQFTKPRAFNFNAYDISVGFSIFIIGLSKKVLIADRIAPIADSIFNVSPAITLTQAEAWYGALAYTLQIYFDFSGYSDMAVGLGRMMGVRLPLNFSSPYKASSIILFWRCWHMTLSRFLRDYLYFALGGNRLGRARRYLNLMITMLLGGLWHGAGWNFVLWGGLHGLYLVVNHGWLAIVGTHQGQLARAVGWLTTFLAVTVAWVFFRATSPEDALRLLTAMAGGNGICLPEFLAAPLRDMLGDAVINARGTFHNALFDLQASSMYIAFGMAVVLLLPNSQELLARHTPALGQVEAAPVWLQWYPNWLWGTVLGVLLALCLARMGGESPFLYFRF